MGKRKGTETDIADRMVNRTAPIHEKYILFLDWRLKVPGHLVMAILATVLRVKLRGHCPERLS